jgi:hydroxymethylglutaryl-CoA reductase
VPTTAGSHPTLGVVHHTAANTQAIQAAIDADKSSSMYYLNPIKVMDRTLGLRGFTTPVRVQLPLKVLVNYGGHQFDVLLTQPGQKGENGVWVISSILRHQV